MQAGLENIFCFAFMALVSRAIVLAVTQGEIPMNEPDVILTGRIAEALRRAVADHESPTEFARKAGVQLSSVTRYLRGLTGRIQARTWRRLEPLLHPYLPPEQPSPQGAVYPRRCRVYGVAHCAVNPITFGDVVPSNEFDLPTVDVPPEITRRPKLAAFRAADNSMRPTINDGDTVYIDPDTPVEDGCIALVKFGDTVVCKRWRRQGKTAILTSDDPTAPWITVPGREVEWAYRVVWITPAGRPA